MGTCRETGVPRCSSRAEKGGNKAELLQGGDKVH